MQAKRVVRGPRLLGKWRHIGWPVLLLLLGVLPLPGGLAWGGEPGAMAPPPPSAQPQQAQHPQQAPVPADPQAALCERLAGEVALGMGRVAARPRPAPAPVAEQPPAGDGLFVPRSRAAYRAEMDARFERNAQAQQAEQTRKNEAFFASVREQCGSAPIEEVHVGMAQTRFEQCSRQVRFGGGLTHLVNGQAQGHTARLYAFAQGDVAWVCAVDGAIARLVPRPAQPQKTTLPQVGAYPPGVHSPHGVALPGGNLFFYGQALADDWTQPAGAALAAWANPAQRTHNSVPPPPLMWDAQRPGWQRLPPPPACEQGLWHQHTLTALPDDRVLVAGGLCDIPRLANDMGTFVPQTRTALWDARQRAWLPSPSLAQPRMHHTASLLDGPRVMLVGGWDDPLTAAGFGADESAKPKVPLALYPHGFRALDSVELLDGDRWRSLPPLHTARAQHTATVLPMGAVLVVGGMGGNQQAMAQVEAWDGAQQRWQPRAPLLAARYGHATTLLADGRVLVTGGIGDSGQALNTTELYDTTTDTWAPGPPLPQHLQGHTALRLPNGRVLLAGGLVDGMASPHWLHTWHPSQPAWRAEGVRDPNLSTQTAHRPLLVPTATGQVLAFGAHAVFLYPEGAANGALATTTANTAATASATAEATASWPHFPADWWQAPPTAKATAQALAAPTAAGEPVSRGLRLGQDLWAARTNLVALAGLLLLVWVVGRAWQGRTGRSGQAGRAWVLRALVWGALLVLALPNLLAYLQLRMQ